ncbi:MAG: hypothetical protein A2381_19245 [Bdellovibrionales bacterium RIFOXYB1_FULL_37_110]|nr:MAG: hypothetical protein A2181_00180 [Bdellovibrionales bacterium RIFOXYA1_FULL_38_20]OFZ49514.1 MAG: hypothetical protein A2417_04395 [Bdellovibrionales bacterium RIFOXYC1_FULL_37_79]OFZ58668.1 MAG: hypothetical protein A2381_19245 [Bdellovibrionales bacterium RIFOXYB1_FULL_37_110]OFZ63214.1 MAG: hypothetical protein A2577_16840 [Bdellovibrionales bacterium RIFOXYD1_FULL_36_51]
MKNKSWFLAILVLVQSAWALDFQNYVVKTYSGEKSIGSGIMINYHNQKTLLLTSSHVVNPLSKVHKIIYDNSNFDAKLIRYSWGKGMALFEIPGINNAGFMIDDFMVGQSLKANLCGYPISSKKIKCDQHGKIISYKSDQHYLPEINETIISYGLGEFGMSGGALLDDHQKVIGMLSHQIISYESAKSSQVTNWNDKINILNLTIISISASDMLQFITETLSGADKEKYEDMLLVDQSIEFDGLKFYFVKAVDEISINPIGGVDPVGIGGETPDSRFANHIVVMRKENSSLTLWGKSIQAEIEKGKKIKITMIKDVNQTYRPISSLEMFFTLANRAGNTVVFKSENINPGLLTDLTHDFSLKLQKISKLLSKLVLIREEIMVVVTSSLDNQYQIKELKQNILQIDQAIKAINLVMALSETNEESNLEEVLKGITHDDVMWNSLFNSTYTDNVAIDLYSELDNLIR